MRTRTVFDGNLENFATLQTKVFDIGFYAQRCPDKTSPNEDAIGVLTYDKTCLLIIADGVGGYPNGEVAAKLAVTNLIESIRKQNPLPTKLSSLRQPIIDAIEETNISLMQNYVGARTTLTVCLIHNNILQSIQIGDSSLIMCGQKGLLKHKTLEHSPVGLAVAAGILKEEAALTHPERHYISNFLGDSDMHMVLGPQIEIASNDTILVASDGLLDNFTSTELVEIIRKESFTDVLNKLTELCQKMQNEKKAANMHKLDDVSFIVWRLAKSLS